MSLSRQAMFDAVVGKHRASEEVAPGQKVSRAVLNARLRRMRIRLATWGRIGVK